jgi:hypothetical protein
LTTDDIVAAALEFEALGATALTPATAPTMRGLADLGVETLALMHGPAFNGDCAAALRGLADGYAKLFAESADGYTSASAAVR